MATTLVDGDARYDAGSATDIGIEYKATPDEGDVIVVWYGGRDNAHTGLPAVTLPPGFDAIGTSDPMERHVVGSCFRESTGDETGFITVDFDRATYSQWIAYAVFTNGAVSEWGLVGTPGINGSNATNVSSIASGSTGVLSSANGLAVVAGTSRSANENLSSTVGAELTGTDGDFTVDAGAANYAAFWADLTGTGALNATVSEANPSSRMGVVLGALGDVAAGGTPNEGVFSGGAELDGDATGSTGVEGSFTGGATLDGDATGARESAAAFDGGTALDGDATGEREASGDYDGGVSLDGSATGSDGSTIDTDFDEGALPAGWTFEQNSAANATIDHSDDFATLTIPAGTTSDNIGSVGGSDGTAGLVYGIAADDFDIAVRIASLRNDDESTTYGFNLREAGDDARMIRWTPYSTGQHWNVYGYERYDGVGDNYQPVETLVSAASLPMAVNPSGSPTWMRASRVGSLYTFYVSYDGALWYETSSVTSSVDADEVKLVLGQFGEELGLPFRYDAVIDLDALGSTDARGTEPVDREAGTTQSVDDFTGGVPAWLALDSTGDGSAAVSGSVVELATGTADGSYGRLEYVGTGISDDAGVLIKAIGDAATRSNAGYAAIGLAYQDGGGDIDEYSAGPLWGYEAQMDGTTDNNQPIRVHRPDPTIHASLGEAYTFVGPDQDWDADGTPSLWCFRVEVFQGWVFMRAWSDGDTEPSTWDFKTIDRSLSLEGALAPYVGISHNDGSPASSQIDVHEVEFYSLVETGLPSDGAFSGGLELDGDATGARESAAEFDGGITLDGDATGDAPVLDVNDGAFSGGVTLDGDVSGDAPVVGVADGAFSGGVTLDGDVSGRRDATAVYDGGLTLDGTAEGDAPTVGGADGAFSGGLELDGDAAGERDSSGLFVGAMSLDGLFVGEVEVAGLFGGGLSLSGVVVGDAPAALGDGTAVDGPTYVVVLQSSTSVSVVGTTTTTEVLT